MRKTILIVEDDKKINAWISAYLVRAGFEVKSAFDGEQGIRLAGQESPDLILLDLMLPKVDGFVVCEVLRRSCRTPIIMLTAIGEHLNRIKGLDLGADDYMVKPFDPGELVARVKAVLRRVENKVEQCLEIGMFRLDMGAYELEVGGKTVELSRTQFDLMTAFMRNPNKVLSRERLITIVFDDNYDAFDRAIDNHILRLRKLISSETHQPIQTVYGAGYKFVPEVA